MSSLTLMIFGGLFVGQAVAGLVLAPLLFEPQFAIAGGLFAIAGAILWGVVHLK